MSTGGTVDTVESLREKLKESEKQNRNLSASALQHIRSEDRHTKINMIDKYVLVVLPALMLRHNDMHAYELGHTAFEIAALLAEVRDEFLAGD